MEVSFDGYKKLSISNGIDNLLEHLMFRLGVKTLHGVTSDV